MNRLHLNHKIRREILAMLVGLLVLSATALPAFAQDVPSPDLPGPGSPLSSTSIDDIELPQPTTVFTVNTLSDTVDAAPGDGVCADAQGKCSLRAAIEESNVSGRQAIDLPAGLYKLQQGQLEIRSSLSLRGSDQKSTVIDGDKQSRIFLVQGTNRPKVIISAVTIQNGMGGTSLPGGGIYNGGSLTLLNSTVTQNETSAPGGGIANAGFLHIVESTIRANKVPLDTGGGTQYSGGGIMNYSPGTLRIERSTIAGNEATRGGGIRNGGGKLEITNSTISGNTAATRGGGIMNFGTADIAFSTITNNEANALPIVQGNEPRTGGGIYNTGTVHIGNTIVAGNEDNRDRFSPEEEFSPDCFSGIAPGDTIQDQFISYRGNLVGILTPNCALRDTVSGDTRFDLVGGPEDPIDPKLQPRADNGGPTQTHALQPDSPAIDQGTGVTGATFFNCPATDQRGVLRPRDGDMNGTAHCDVGAYEGPGSLPVIIVNRSLGRSKVVILLNHIPAPNAPAGVLTIEVVFTNTSSTSLKNLIFQVSSLTSDNPVLNADGGPGGVGAQITVPAAALGSDGSLDPGESFTARFEIGLVQRQSFQFVVDAYGMASDTVTEASADGGDSFSFTINEEQLRADQHQFYLPLLSR